MDLRTNNDYFPSYHNWLVCITETACVQCAVGTEFLYIIRNNLNLQKAVMAQAVSHWPLTAAALVRSRLRFCNRRSGNGTGVSPSTSVFLCQYISTNAPHSSSSTCRSYQKDKRAKPGNHPKSNDLSKIGEHWIEEYFQLIFKVFTNAVCSKCLLWKIFISNTSNPHFINNFIQVSR